MTDEPAFNLRSFVREVSESVGSPDPHVLSQAVVDKLADSFLRSALAATLPDFIRRMFAGDRGHSRRDSHTTDSSEPVPVRSARWEGVGAVYLKFLQESVFTGKEWKFRGDCTAADCLAVYELKLDQAKAVAVEARREQLLAQAMDKHDAKTVADLSEIIVLEVLRWQP